MSLKNFSYAALTILSMSACSPSSSNGGGGATDSPDTAYEKASNVRCANPISLDNNGGSESLLSAHGRYALKTMQMYSVTSTGDSALATASSAQKFKISVDCNGTSENLATSLTTGTEIDLDTNQNNGEAREFDVDINKGSITNAVSKLLKSEASSGGRLTDVPKGRFQSGDGYMTLNANLISPTTLEIKVKLESLNGDAKVAEYGRFTFEREH